MAALMADATVDEVVFARCEACADVYATRDGWDGACPACCALADDHDAGQHDFADVPGCRACDVADDRLDLSAIA